MVKKLRELKRNRADCEEWILYHPIIFNNKLILLRKT